MSKNLPIGTTIFSTMSALATKHGAINLSQGFPNFPIDEKLSEILAKVASEDSHQYMPMSGYLPLLEQIARIVSMQYGREVSVAKNILVTAGATQAIFTTILALIRSQDEVIILDPAYDCYDSPILIAQATPIHINLTQDFTPDWELISKACNNSTKLIIINNPHNPTGKLWRHEDYLELEKLLKKFPKMLVLADEVYEFITFENKHLSIHQYNFLHQRCIAVSSFGKSLHITGWKVGYIIAPEDLLIEIKKVHQFCVFSVNSVAQKTLSDYLPLVNLQNLGSFYQKKRDYFKARLTKSNFDLLPCEGTYFQTVSYAKISQESDVNFCTKLVQEFGVAAIPLSSFYSDYTDRQLIRFCFAKEQSTLEDATNKLKHL